MEDLSTVAQLLLSAGGCEKMHCLDKELKQSHEYLWDNLFDVSETIFRVSKFQLFLADLQEKVRHLKGKSWQL